MNTLPSELLDRISSFLDVDDLKRTLFVSGIFQAAAERYSGAFTAFIFKNNDDDRQRFLSTYSGRRLPHLRYIEIHTDYTTLKPWDIEMDPDELPCRESRTELREKDELFTEQVKHVFKIVKEAETRAGHAHYGPGKIHLVILTPVRWVNRSFCRHRLSSAWRVHLLRPEELPELASVRSLSICNPEVGTWTGERFGDDCALSRLDWRVVIDVASRLPNLEYLGSQLGIEEGRHLIEDVGLEHFQHDYEACARDSRFGIAKALERAILSPSLKWVQMDFLNDYHQHVAEDRGGGPDLVSPASCDLFSTSLRTFSSSLRRLDLRLKADSTLFWTPYGSISSSNLEVLNVMFHPTAPSGSWYFRGPNGEGENDLGYAVKDDMYPPLEDNPADAAWHFKDIMPYDLKVDRFRVVPNEGTLYPFLEAFAKAASNMHKLKSASLWAPLDNGLAWGVRYLRPGEPYNPTPDVGARGLWWSVGRWRPHSALHKLFQDIGRAEHGEKLIEYWNYFCGDEEEELEPDEVFTDARPALTGGFYPPGRYNVLVKHPRYR